MFGLHYELTYGQENCECNGRAVFTFYGPTRGETKVWGDQQCWDYIHEHRPTRRALKEMKSAPVADYLLTDQGPQPLDFDQVREKMKTIHRDDFAKFGRGSSGRVGGRLGAGREAETDVPHTLAALRAKLEEHFRPGMPGYDHILRETNWDPAEQAYYIFTVFDPITRNCSEAVLCRAVNFHHAASIWCWEDGKGKGLMRPANFSLANGFQRVGEPLFCLRQPRPRPPSE